MQSKDAEVPDKKPRRVMRCCVLQLESHPAFSISGKSLISEPFIPQAEESPTPFLSLLRGHGYPVRRAQEHCRVVYCRWAYDRLNAVLRDIERVDVAGRRPRVDIVVLPEGGAPCDTIVVDGVRTSSLALLASFARTHRCTIFAGTHALREDVDYAACFDLEGFKVHRTEIAEVVRRAREGGTDNPTVLPVLHSTGRVELILKSTQAPFESDDQGAEVEQASRPILQHTTIDVWRPIGGPAKDASSELVPAFDVRVLACVCSDSLRLPDSHDEQITVICAYEARPSRYRAEIETRTANQQLVLLSNDGRYGGSGAFFTRDQRGASWWFSSPIDGGLPRGDSLLLIDVALDRLHAAAGVHNPQTNYSIRRLAAIVPDRTGDPQARVAVGLESTLQFLEADVFVNQDEIAVELDELVAREQPRGLQELKLHRLLCLAEARQLTARRARMLCQESLVSSARIRDMQATLARFCLAVATQLLNDAGRAGRDYEALKNFRDACGRRLGVRGSMALVPLLWMHLEGTLAKVRIVATQALVHSTAEMTEYFNATSAWLYSRHDVQAGSPAMPRHWQLIERAAHNANQRNEIIRDDEYSAMAWTARMNSSFLAQAIDCEGEIQLPFYKALSTRTRAELAVPVRGPISSGGAEVNSKGDVLAVLNLESNDEGAFNAAQALELSVLSNRITPDLILLSSIEARMRSAGKPSVTTSDAPGTSPWMPTSKFAWHPDQHGWGLKRLLDEVAYLLATALPVGASRPYIACTIWNVDRAKGELRARGCAGFGYEYQADMPIPILGTFLGSAVEGGTVLRGAIEDFGIWRRKVKAQRMELTTLVATPFSWPDGSTEGLLSFFFYKDQSGPVRAHEIEQVFDDDTVSTLGTIVGRLAQKVRTLQTEYAKARLRAEMPGPWSQSENLFHRALRILIECLECDAGSIFLVGERIQLVATTGAFEREPSSSGEQEACADLDDAQLFYKRKPEYEGRFESTPEDPISGITQWLAENPGYRIRKNVVLTTAEPVRVSESESKLQYFAPSKRVIEYRPLGEVSRFLACSEVDQSTDWKIVVRLIRNESARPFVLADERMLQELVRELIRSCPGLLSSSSLNRTRAASKRFEEQSGINVSWSRWSIAQLFRDTAFCVESLRKAQHAWEVMSLSFTIEGRMEEFDDYHVFSSPNASGALAKIAGGLNDDLGQRNLYESLPSQIGTAIKEGRAQAFTGSTVLSEKRLSLLSKLTGFDDGLTFFVIPFRWYGLGRTKRAGLICATSGSNYSSELGEEVLDLLRESAKKLTCMGGAASLRARDGSLAPIINGAREGTSILDFVEILKRSDIDAARIQYLEGTCSLNVYLNETDSTQHHITCKDWALANDSSDYEKRILKEATRRWKDLVVDAELPGNIDEGCDPALNQLVEIVEGLWFIDRRVAEVVLFAQPDECERARRVLSAILARWTAFCGLASRENGVGA